MSASNDRHTRANERQRRRHRPATIRLLFIGESPPASGRFFYNQDSGLYRAMRDAFREVDPTITDGTFLEVFQKTGCYLIDACNDPVDQLDPPSRRAACAASEGSLAKKLRTLRPQAIATLVVSIRKNVDRAIEQANWQGPRLDLPYPGRWIRHREVFVTRLLPHLKTLISSKPL